MQYFLLPQGGYKSLCYPGVIIFVSQVGLPFRCVTLEQDKGERAMLLRNGSGDWGIVKGQWICFRRGYIPSNDGKLINSVIFCIQKIVWQIHSI